ncbi:hypothetical protein D3C84_848010 [compost metagenome]
MVAAGSVDDGVGGSGLVSEKCAVVKRADDWRDAQRFQFIRLFGVAHQARDAVTCLDQAGGDGTTDKTRCTGNEYVHGETPCVDK